MFEGNKGADPVNTRSGEHMVEKAIFCFGIRGRDDPLYGTTAFHLAHRLLCGVIHRQLFCPGFMGNEISHWNM